jgi:Transcriptional regulators of sugar metabolism
MNAEKRRTRIFNIMQEQETVEINELAAVFDVSTMTIRRDLIHFKEQGLITMTYGGAYLNTGTSIEPSFLLKSSQMIEKKQIIGMEAAKLVEDGDTIIIDCGTTTLQMVKYIQDKNITVLTSSWPIANYLSKNSKIKLILAPGEYDISNAGVFSSITIDFFRNYYADKVFMGAQGIDIKQGITVTEILDAEIKKSLFHAAKTKILLVDSVKYEQKYFAKYADLNQFDYIISDNENGKPYSQKLKKICKNVIIADYESYLKETKEEE